MTEHEKNFSDPKSDLLRQGQKLQEAGKLLDAAKFYQAALAQNPQDTEALLSLSVLARQSHQQLLSLQVAREIIRLKPNDPRHVMNLAHAYRAIGSPLEAIRCCELVLNSVPEFVAAHCVLGELLYGIGETEAAREHYRQAILKQPAFAHVHCLFGNLECQEGNHKEAIEHYSQAVAHSPEWAEAYFALGYALHQVRDRNGATQALSRALELRPRFPEALQNLGNLFFDYGEMKQAAHIYRLLVRMDPNRVNSHCNLGNALTDLNHFSEAAKCYQTALTLDPNSSFAMHKLGNLAVRTKEWQKAEKCLRRVLELTPKNAEAYNDLGNIFFHQRRLVEAAECYRKALALKPNLAIAHSNVGNALQDMGHYEEAIVCYEKSVELDPSNPGVHYNLSLALLSEGNYELGWKEHEWRWDFKELMIPRRPFQEPLWKGEPLHGKRILLHAEQGLGDTMQFVRYMPLVAARGGHVILEVAPALYRLMADIPGVSEIVSRGTPLPQFDYQCPLMSLPIAFQTTVETIPGDFPYLQVQPADAERAKAIHSGEGLRVGLAWAGNFQNKRDDLRSLRLKQFLPLSRIPGVSFFALQQGPATAEIEEVSTNLPLNVACCSFRDFYETAALVKSLDLVICVDTAVAHLAGAMDKPVWLLLPYIADWRWMRDREDSVWYPSARLFRQSKPGDWEGVMVQVSEALAVWAQGNANKSLAKEGKLLPWSGQQTFSSTVAAL
jgi:tetratricopeptide (TPR) repeat protein